MSTVKQKGFFRIAAAWPFRATEAATVPLRKRWLNTAAISFGLIALFCLGLVIAVAPWLPILLGTAVAVVLAAFALAAYATAGAPLWIRACAAVVMAQLVLNYGFATVVIPIGAAPIPISELVLTLALCACLYHMFLAKVPVRAPALIWVCSTWVVLNLALHLPMGMNKHGLAAARDALPTLEVLFLLPGYVAASLMLARPDGGRAFLGRVLAVGLLVSALYGLTYGFQDTLLQHSPRLPSIQQSVPVLGSFQTWPLVGLLGILTFSLWRWQTDSPLNLSGWAAGILIFVSGAYTFFAVQSRAAYLIVGFFLLLLLLLGGQAKRVLVIFGAIIAASLVLLLMETLGLEFKGRISNLSSSQILDHLITLSGDSRVAEFQGAAAGIGQRRAWIDHSLGLWQRDVGSMFFGIGFGDVLTDHTVVGFQRQTILVREPHNSFVSILTRSGLIGLTVNLLLHGTVLAAVIGLYRRHYRTDRGVAAVALAVLFVHLYCLFTALGQPTLESPHYAVPLHFLLGAVYALTVKHRVSHPAASATTGSPRQMRS